jgi:hypothetical protein
MTTLINLPMVLQNEILSYSDPDQDYFICSLTCSTFKDLIKVPIKTKLSKMINSISLFEWSLSNGCPRDKKFCNKITYNGRLDILKLAYKNGFLWNEQTCNTATYSGNLDILKWVYNNGCPLNEQTCAIAVYLGRFDILKWARENGCSWNEDVCDIAIYSGRLDILKWSRENGCPLNLDKNTSSSNVYECQINLAQLAFENGLPFKNITKYRY